jgi:hypothetical protein
MHAMRQTWDRCGPVVLRADPELVGALLQTDRETEIGRKWLGRMRFESVAVTFVEPLRIRDGDQVCIYRGFFAAGTVSRSAPGWPPSAAMVAAGSGAEPMWTTYRPFSESEDVRILWLLEYEGHPNLRGGQTMAHPLRTGKAGPRTISQFIERLNRAYQRSGHGDDDAALLTPLGLLLLMYLSSSEPDLADVEPRSPTGNTTSRKGPRVINLGLRVGAALRSWRKGSASGAGPAGWRLPPHIRAAHWRRSRLARRDDTGAIVGDVHGAEGAAWDYIWYWIPPTPVNVSAEGPTPAVRQLRH